MRAFLPLQRQIEELNVQNQALLEKLNAEENRRKSAEKSQVLFLLIIPENVSTTRADRKLQRLPGGFLCKIPNEDYRNPWSPDSRGFSPQRDSHTLYLEQELDSLKVVLDIKNQQLHQQEKKLMELEKLVRWGADGNNLSSSVLIPFCFFSLQKDKNVKLDESLTKVQQENEHLKARMDRHAALSR